MSAVDVDELLDELDLHDTSQATVMTVLEAVTRRPTVHRTRRGASTLEVTADDPDGEVWDSLGGPLWASTGPLTWDLVSIRRTPQARVRLVFEDSVVSAMRRRRDPLSIPAGATTLTELTERFAAEVGVPVLLDPTRRVIPTVVERSTRSSSDSWQALDAAAAAVGCTRFSDGRRLIVGDDAWLLEQAAQTMRPDNGVIGEISGARDIAKVDDVATTDWTRSEWDPNPGEATILDEAGPLDGRWLIEALDYELGAETGTLRWTRPTEPWAGPTGGEPDWLPGPTGTEPTIITPGPAGRAAAWALRQVGQPYGSGAAGPAAYDAPGLVRAATHHAGRLLAGGTVADLWDRCRATGTTTTVQAALATTGALLFRLAPIPHIAISLGNGSVVEARGPAYGVVVSPAVDRSWTGGAVWL